MHTHISNIKAVRFDLDGTVAYTLPDLLRAINKMRSSFSLLPIDGERLIQCINYGGRTMVSKALDDPDDSAFVDEAFNRYRDFYKKETVVDTVPYEGITEMLDSLRASGIKTALLTNKDNCFVSEIESKLFEGKFDIAMGYTDRFPHKPDPQSALYILKELQVSPENALFVGDSPVDMKTASGCKMNAAWVSWGYAGDYSMNEHPGAIRIDHPAEITALIK